jgi:RNA polymerase sigma factor (TIGR02999 family)
MVDASPDVTALLLAWNGGDEDAGTALMTAVYADLKRMAARRLRSERDGHSLAPTALVHETYLRLVNQTSVQWRNRAQFFALAAQLMRRVLVDHARARDAEKRGGIRVSVRGDDSSLVAGEPALHQAPLGIDMLALDRALERLKAVSPRHSGLVEVRFFGGLSVEEAAEVLNVSRATVVRDWAFARAWLYRELGGPDQ